VIGLAAPWLKGRPLWTERLRFPVASLVLAVAGVVGLNARFSGLPLPAPNVVVVVLGVTGAGLLGVAIALTLVTQPAARLVLSTLMGAACMVIVGYTTLHSTIVIYLIAVALWWIRRTARILADNLPPRWWRTFTPAHQSHRDPDTTHGL
jgi:4-hydroxybenzoate polyprenyltransferase